MADTTITTSETEVAAETPELTIKVDTVAATSETTSSELSSTLDDGSVGGSVSESTAGGVDIEGCQYAFISVVPGSRIWIGRDTEIGGCPSDGFIVFSPVGDPRPNMLMKTELQYPYGIALVDDSEIAKRIRKAIQCGSAPFKEFDPNLDGDLGCYIPQLTKSGCPSGACA